MMRRRSETRLRRREAGFTLIEMIIGVALLAMLMALLASSIGLARQALTAVDRSSSALPVEGAQTYLRGALAQAMVTQRMAANGDRELTFSGTAESMSFTTAFAPKSQLDGLYRVDLKVERPADGRPGLDLLVTQSLERSASAAALVPPTRRMSRVLTNIRSAAFSYLVAADGNQAPEWRDAYAALDRLPRMIAIDVTFAPTDGRTWQRLVVPVTISDATAAPCPPRGAC